MNRNWLEYLPGWGEIRCQIVDTLGELRTRPGFDRDLAAALTGITAAGVERHITALTAGGPRWREDEENVRETLRHLREELSGYGYPVVETRYGEAPHQVNLFATLPGRDIDAPLVEVGAHWDSKQGSPGADDNASGVAGLLETARALRTLGPRQRGVRFCLFGEEEEWMLGSREHVSDIEAGGEVVEGLIVLEMIGFRDARPGAQRSPLRIPGCSRRRGPATSSRSSPTCAHCRSPTRYSAAPGSTFRGCGSTRSSDSGSAQRRRTQRPPAVLAQWSPRAARHRYGQPA